MCQAPIMYQILFNPQKLSQRSINIPSLQMNKLKHRDIKWLAEVFTSLVKDGVWI